MNILYKFLQVSCRVLLLLLGEHRRSVKQICWGQGAAGPGDPSQLRRLTVIICSNRSCYQTFLVRECLVLLILQEENEQEMTGHLGTQKLRHLAPPHVHLNQ